MNDLAATQSSPPLAAIRPRTIASPSGIRVDDYYWLRDDTRSDPEVLAYLTAENAWREAGLRRLQPLTERLYQEFVGRIRQDDASVPYRRRGHWYLRRFETGDEYPVYRATQGHAGRGGTGAPRSSRTRPRAREFYELGGFDVSRDESLLAWTEDRVGRRQYILRFLSLIDHRVLEDAIENVEAQVVWLPDNASVLYVEKDPQTLLGLRVRRHVLGTSPAEDALVYEEHDESFYTWIDSSKDERFLLIGSTSTLSTELRFARADDPSLSFEVLLPREPDHEYEAEPFRRPLDHPHQPWRAELPPRRSRFRHRSRRRYLARADRAPRRREYHGLRRVRRRFSQSRNARADCGDCGSAAGTASTIGTSSPPSPRFRWRSGRTRKWTAGWSDMFTHR